MVTLSQATKVTPELRQKVLSDFVFRIGINLPTDYQFAGSFNTLPDERTLSILVEDGGIDLRATYYLSYDESGEGEGGIIYTARYSANGDYISYRDLRWNRLSRKVNDFIECRVVHPYIRHTAEYVYTSDDILKMLEGDGSGMMILADAVCSSAIVFNYRLTEGELGWLGLIRGKYQIADYIDAKSDHGVLTISDADEMSRALDDDCKGAGKAVMLSDDTALQAIFFWLHMEQLDDDE